MHRFFCLLLLGLALAAAGCKKDAAPGTVSGPVGPLERSKQSPKPIPLPP